MPSQLRVLLIERDAATADRLLSLLHDADLEATLAVDVPQATDVLTATSFDAVVFDATLVADDGRRLGAALRERPESLALVGYQRVAEADGTTLGDSTLSLDSIDAEALRRAVDDAMDEVATRPPVGGVLLDRCPYPAWVYDCETLRFLAVSESAVDTYGYSEAEFLRMTIADIRPPDEAGRLRERLAAGLPSSQQGETARHRDRKGRVFPVELGTSAVEFHGRPARLVIARDISAQRRAIEAMEASYRRFRDLFEHARGFICTHDAEGVIQAINPAAAESIGYSVGELIGRPMTYAIPPQLHPVFAEYLERIARVGSDSGMLYLLHRDGRRMIWEYNNRAYHDADGSLYVMGHAQDATERREYERRLRAQQAELEAVNDAAPLGLFHTDVEGKFTYVNRVYEQISGQYAGSAFVNGWLQAVHPDERDRVRRAWLSAVAAAGRFQSAHRLVHLDGRIVWASVQAAPIVVDGVVTGFVGSIEDVSARRHVEERLRRSERRLRTMADALPAMIAYVDAKLRYVFANAAYEKHNRAGRTGSLVGRSVPEVLGEEGYARRKPHIDRALRGERVTFEDEAVVDGERRWLEFTYIPQFDEDETEVVGIHAMLHDITKTKVEEKRLIELAAVDSLTGLSNRSGFLARLDQALARSRDQQTLIAVMYLDIDHFKRINDTYGHPVGDALLQAFARRLTASLRSSDVIGRIGGDEFTVISEGIRRREYAAALAAKIVTAMRRPFQLEGHSLHVSSSVGVAFSRGGGTPDELLEAADAALYQAKQSGRNTYRVAPGEEDDGADENSGT